MLGEYTGGVGVGVGVGELPIPARIAKGRRVHISRISSDVNLHRRRSPNCTPEPGLARCDYGLLGGAKFGAVRIRDEAAEVGRYLRERELEVTRHPKQCLYRKTRRK